MNTVARSRPASSVIDFNRSTAVSKSLTMVAFDVR
jgi:hypothetical protein